MIKLRKFIFFLIKLLFDQSVLHHSSNNAIHAYDTHVRELIFPDVKRGLLVECPAIIIRAATFRSAGSS